jgi:hypothetical protein
MLREERPRAERRELSEARFDPQGLRRIRRRTTALVAMPAIQPASAATTMIQTSRALESPKTQLIVTRRVLAAVRPTRMTVVATRIAVDE